MKFSKLLISTKSIVIFIGILLSTHAYSEEHSGKTATYKDWIASSEKLPKKMCWATSGISEPSKNTRNGIRVDVKRSAIQLFITYFPEEKNPQVSFTGGYPFAEDSSVTMNINGNDFFLRTFEEFAWAETNEQDLKIIAAMKKGSKAILTAKSTRGTRTQDTFSLMGFTAAIEDAEKRCK